MFGPDNRVGGAYLRSTSKTYVHVGDDEDLDIRPSVNPNAFTSDSIRYRSDSRFISQADDSSDSETDRGPPVLVQAETPKRRREHPLYNQTNGYILIFVIVGSVVLFTLRFNRHEIHRLKEDRGHDMKSPRDKQIWWHNALMYQIFPRSFQDSNGDGVGDINGIIDRLPYLTGLGVQAVILCSLHASRGISSDTGVLNYNIINPILGSMEDFRRLVQELHDRDMKLIIELIPNHTSDEHPWFQQSRAGGNTNKYKDYYIWHPGRRLANGEREPPNNWLSRYGGSIWTWDEKRGEYYLHQYGHLMPDLNHRNPYVRQEFIEIYREWLDRGVDGIYLEGVQALFEVDELELDEPTSDTPGVEPGDWLYLSHVYTDDQPEIHEFLATWREEVDAFMHRTGKRIFLGVEVMDDQVADIIHYYLTGADAPLSLVLADIDKDCDAYCVHDVVDTWLVNVPEEKASFWAASNHEVGRLSSRKGAVYKGVLAMIQLLLPGGAVVYYGDEIGMEHHSLGVDDTVDEKHFSHRSHNGSRTPMQWSAGNNAGFSTANATWLPVHPGYTDLNVEAELTHSEPDITDTMLKLYRKLTWLRSQPSIQHGRFQFARTTANVFSFMRYSYENTPYFMALNFGGETSTDDYTLYSGVELGRVVCHTIGGATGKTLRENEEVNLSRLTLAPGEGMVVKLF